MKIRFQADADLDPDVGRGLIRRETRIEWRPAEGFIPDATPDSEVLRLAAAAGRVLVSRMFGRFHAISPRSYLRSGHQV